MKGAKYDALLAQAVLAAAAARRAGNLSPAGLRPVREALLAADAADTAREGTAWRWYVEVVNAWPLQATK